MNSFAALAALDVACSSLTSVCARAEGRLESLMGAKGELSTRERLLQRFGAAHSALSDLLDPAPPAMQVAKPRGLLDAVFGGGRSAAPAEPDAATMYPPPVTPNVLREPSGGLARLPALETHAGDPIADIVAPEVENPFDDAPPPAKLAPRMMEPTAAPMPLVVLPPQAPPPAPVAAQPMQSMQPPPPPPKPAAAAPPQFGEMQPRAASVEHHQPVAPPSSPFENFFDAAPLQSAPHVPVQQMPPIIAQTMPPPLPEPPAPNGNSISRHGGAVHVRVKSHVAVNCTETVHAAFQGCRIVRSCARGLFAVAPPGASPAAPALLALDTPPGTQFRVRPGHCTQQSGLIALTAAGPCLAYQLSPEASTAAVPMQLHAAVTGLGASVVLAVRVTSEPQLQHVPSSIVIEAPRPEGAAGPPIAANPSGMWDEATSCFRWVLPGPPPARALLRVRFQGTAVAPRQPMEAAVRLQVSLSYTAE